MNKQFKYYQVMVTKSQFETVEDNIEACSPGKAAELFFDENKAEFEPGHYAAVVQCENGVDFPFAVEVK